MTKEISLEDLQVFLGNHQMKWTMLEMIMHFYSLCHTELSTQWQMERAIKLLSNILNSYLHLEMDMIYILRTCVIKTKRVMLASEKHSNLETTKFKVQS